MNGTVLYCNVLNWVLYYTENYAVCTVYCTVLNCNSVLHFVLYCTALCTILYRTMCMYYTVLNCDSVLYCGLYCNALCNVGYCTVYCTALCTILYFTVPVQLPLTRCCRWLTSPSRRGRSPGPRGASSSARRSRRSWRSPACQRTPGSRPHKHLRFAIFRGGGGYTHLWSTLLIIL